MSTELIGVGELKRRKVHFPFRCVFCGGAANSTVHVDMRSDDIRDVNKLRLDRLDLPYCLKDAALNEKYKTQYNTSIGILGFLVILITVVGWNLTDQPASSFLLLVAFVAGGIFLVNKILLMVVPIFQKIPTFLQKGALGVIIKEISYQHRIGAEFKFSNAEYAAEFARLNLTILIK